MRLAEQWAKVEPDQTGPNEAMAEICAERGKPELAILHLKKALEIVPSASDVHAALAELYEEQGRKTEASRHFQQAIEWMDAEATERIQELVARIEALKQ